MFSQNEREKLLVELVDTNGMTIGKTTVLQAHSYPGLLHRAFSIFLFNSDNTKLLVQQRSASKIRWPLYWANTCCGHTQVGLTVVESAFCRLKEEIGIVPYDLFIAGKVIYRADYAENYSEYEWDHVLIGHINETDKLYPNPDECEKVEFISISKDKELEPIVPWYMPCKTIVDEYLSKRVE